MDVLIAKKELYRCIDENGKRVLTETGMSIAGNQTLMDADAVDFDSETAIFIPLKQVDSFRLWESAINATAGKKLFYTPFSDTVIEIISRGEMIP